MHATILRSALALLLALAGTAPARAMAPDAAADAVTLYGGRGVGLRLLDIPRGMMKGDLREEGAYFAGLGYGRTLGTLGESFAALRGSGAAGVRHGFEVLALKHSGLQHHTELGAAYVLRSPDIALSDLRVNFAAGAGVSHALGRASYDDPARDHRTLVLALFEAEWRRASAPTLALVTRVHHRSGVYGLVAPRGVGSNFITLGARYRY